LINLGENNNYQRIKSTGRIREKLQTTIQSQDDEKLRGYEGAGWYVTTANMERVFFKCKIDGINKNRV
jgi:hypothetical protein